MTSADNLPAYLNLFTLSAVLIVAIVAALLYFRKSGRWHPMGKDEGIKTDMDAAHRANVDPPRAKDVRN